MGIAQPPRGTSNSEATYAQHRVRDDVRGGGRSASSYDVRWTFRAFCLQPCLHLRLQCYKKCVAVFLRFPGLGATLTPAQFSWCQITDATETDELVNAWESCVDVERVFMPGRSFCEAAAVASGTLYYRWNEDRLLCQTMSDCLNKRSSSTPWTTWKVRGACVLHPLNSSLLVGFLLHEFVGFGDCFSTAQRWNLANLANR